MTPRFSIVMPTYQRRAVLERVLAAWDRQDAGEAFDFELVVVDDGSQDGTAELLERTRPRTFTLHWLRQENAGPAAARNRALARARGELVLFTGDDIEPARGLLARHHEAHLRLADPRAAVLGLIRWPPAGPTTATMRHVDGVGSQQFSYQFMRDGETYDFRHLYTSNVSLPRHCLTELVEEDGSGPFSTAFSAAAFEDAELGYRLARRGLRIVYHAAALAYHHHPYTAESFYRRQQRCGEMAAVLLEHHPELRRFLDLEILENLRLELALAPEPARGDADALRSNITRALELARFYDPLPYPLVDDLLVPLFRFAYLEGLARALYPQRADPLLARLFHQLVRPAVTQLVGEAERRGLPCPGV